MKRSFSFLAVIVVVATCGFFIWSGLEHARQRAIAGVLSEYKTVNAQYRSEFSQTRTLPNGRTIHELPRNLAQLRREYVAALGRIPTDGCPDVFRLAWLNYVQTQERAENPLYALAATTEGAVSIVKPSPAVLRDALARLDRLNAPEAWRQVEVAALNYGVQFVGP